MAVVTIQQSVAALYVAVFNRAPDQAGLNAWTNAITSGQSTFAQVAAGFAAHEVFTTGIGALSNTAYVAALYTNILGSAGDAAGIANWTAQLNAGQSKAAVAALFVQAALTVDIPAMLAAGSLTAAEAAAATVRQDTLTNKANTGIYFAETLKAASNLNPLTVQSSKAGLEADPIYNASKAAIANVTNTAASVQSAKDAISVAAGTANPAQSLLGGTFMLTAGADTPATTAGNDTINALTIDATGAAAETFSAFDNIDGGAGTDTLNIYTTATLNEGFPTSATVKNVEVINLYNSSTTANQQFGTTAAVDASKFTGATQIWQIGAANNNGIANVAATTTAGLRNLTADDTVNTSVAAATGAASINVALDAVKGKVTTNVVTLGVSGDAVAAVNVSGTIAQQTVNATAASLALGVTTGKNVETLTVNTAVKTTLTVTESADVTSTKNITTVDASASTGGVTYDGSVADAGAGYKAVTVKTGSGDDVVTIATVTAKDNAATTAVDETVSALLETNAGKDTITVNTSGDGTTAVNAGAGDDTVTLDARGSGKLTVTLGDGNDSFKFNGGAVGATDAIDAGAGTDTLQLKGVGVANIGAFQNFEVFDVAGMTANLDVDVLATKNTVTEIVGTGALAATVTTGVANVSLLNLGAGVGFRATADMTYDGSTASTNGVDNGADQGTLTLTQKVAGALTVTLDADNTSTTAQNDDSIFVIASNATSLKAVFDTDSGFVQTSTDKNDQSIALTGSKATSLEVVSGGTNATNSLTYVYGNGTSTGNADGLLTSVTVSGAQALTLAFSDGTNDLESNIATINASSMTGGLIVNLGDLKAGTADSTAVTFGGVVKLGSGDDVVTGASLRAIEGIEKGTAENAAAQSNFDLIAVTNAYQASDVAAGVVTGAAAVKDGLLTFSGTGPATLVDALVIANAAAETTNEALVFDYIGNSYVFVQGGGTDTVIQLVGVTGLTGLDGIGTNATESNNSTNLYVF